MTYHILIVEDDPSSQKTLVDIFEGELGYNVTAVSGVAAAIRALGTSRTTHQPFDLVVVDVDLSQSETQEISQPQVQPLEPDTSGLYVIEHILNNYQGEICCIISNKEFGMSFFDSLTKYTSIVRGTFPKGKGLKNTLLVKVPEMIKAHKKRNQKIFISYRRADSQDISLRIRDTFVQHFGKQNIFIDVHNDQTGKDYKLVIHDFISSCDAVLVVIGTTWLSVKDSDGNRRLDDPKDVLRMEVAEALTLGIRVIPLLVHDAQMPTEGQLPTDMRPLINMHGMEISSDARFEDDIRNLIRSLEH